MIENDKKKEWDTHHVCKNGQLNVADHFERLFCFSSLHSNTSDSLWYSNRFKLRTRSRKDVWRSWKREAKREDEPVDKRQTDIYLWRRHLLFCGTSRRQQMPHYFVYISYTCMCFECIECTHYSTSSQIILILSHTLMSLSLRLLIINVFTISPSFSHVNIVRILYDCKGQHAVGRRRYQWKFWKKTKRMLKKNRERDEKDLRRGVISTCQANNSNFVNLSQHRKERQRVVKCDVSIRSFYIDVHWLKVKVKSLLMSLSFPLLIRPFHFSPHRLDDPHVCVWELCEKRAKKSVCVWENELPHRYTSR